MICPKKYVEHGRPKFLNSEYKILVLHSVVFYKRSCVKEVMMWHCLRSTTDYALVPCTVSGKPHLKRWGVFAGVSDGKMRIGQAAIVLSFVLFFIHKNVAYLMLLLISTSACHLEADSYYIIVSQTRS